MEVGGIWILVGRCQIGGLRESGCCDGGRGACGGCRLLQGGCYTSCLALSAPAPAHALTALCRAVLCCARACLQIEVRFGFRGEEDGEGSGGKQRAAEQEEGEEGAAEGHTKQRGGTLLANLANNYLSGGISGGGLCAGGGVSPAPAAAAAAAGTG
jgi:hypothetical protein